MFTPGKRAFVIGCIALIVVAALHTMGHFSPPPPDPRWDALERSLKEYTFQMPIFSPTAYDVVQSLSLTMTVTFLALGVIGLGAARWCDAAIVRRFALVLAFTIAALIVLFWYYRVAPPFITLLPVEFLFLIALACPRPTAA